MARNRWTAVWLTVHTGMAVKAPPMVKVQKVFRTLGSGLKLKRYEYTLSQPRKEWINEFLIESISQSLSQSVNQAISESVKRTINQSINQNHKGCLRLGNDSVGPNSVVSVTITDDQTWIVPCAYLLKRRANLVPRVSHGNEVEGGPIFFKVAKVFYVIPSSENNL